VSLYQQAFIVNKDVIKIKNKRNTLQKKIILDTIRNFDSHPTVEDISAKVKTTYPTISKNTVYRNLRQLADNGEIRKLSLPGEQERYDNFTCNHYHFKCKSCDRILDIVIDCLEDVNKTAEQKYGFKVYEHELVFRGICTPCEESPQIEN